jgi:hypothetical protein
LVVDTLETDIRVLLDIQLIYHREGGKTLLAQHERINVEPKLIIDNVAKSRPIKAESLSTRHRREN